MKLLLASLLPIAVFACPDGYEVVYDGVCSKNLGNNIKTSRTSCYAADGHLPIIRSLNDYNELTQTYGKVYYWIDLSCDGLKFTWSDGSSAQYTNFKGGVTCDSSNKGAFFYINSNDGFWYSSTDPTYGDYSVCQLNIPNYVCDSRDVITGTGKNADMCYLVETAPIKWADAEAKCVKQEAHLAVVHDQTTNDALKRTAIAYGLSGGIHLGLQHENGSYLWSDGTSMDYTNFATGFPDDYFGDCVSMMTVNTKAQWMNMQCDVSVPYICMKPAVVFNSQAVPAGCPEQDQYFPGDELFSPTWPQATGPASCEYVFMVHDAKKIQVEIVFFEANKCCDKMTFYEGMFAGDVIKSVTGYLGYSSTRVTASSNTMRMQWDAKSGANVRGWHLKVQAV